jgi:hypothetical protein
MTLPEAAQLLGRQVAAGDLDLHVLKPSWICGCTLAARKRSNSTGRRWASRRRRDRRERACSSMSMRRPGDVEVALGDPVALELLVDLLAQLLDAELVDEDLQAGTGAVDAQPVLAVEDAEDGLGDGEVLAVVGGDELVERRRDARHDRRAAADADLEALDAVDLARDERDVVDAGDRAVLVGAAERGLDLARHELRRGVAHEVAHVGAAYGVVSKISSHTPAHGSPVTLRTVLPQPSRLDRPESEMIRMNLAASRSGMWCTWMFWRVVMWPLSSGAYSSIASANASICSGRHAAHRQLDADHLHVGLALAVDALLQAEADELVLGRLTVRNFSASLSKSSNSRWRIGMMCPGTSSRTSGSRGALAHGRTATGPISTRLGGYLGR